MHHNCSVYSIFDGVYFTKNSGNIKIKQNYIYIGSKGQTRKTETKDGASQAEGPCLE